MDTLVFRTKNVLGEGYTLSHKHRGKEIKHRFESSAEDFVCHVVLKIEHA